jgi:hypothetical protein
MGERSKAWEIAADLEAAAKAVLAADAALSAVHDSALPEIEAIAGTEFVEPAMATALQALSAKYQAIADAEPEPGSDEWLKQSPQFHPGDLA